LDAESAIRRTEPGAGGDIAVNRLAQNDIHVCARDVTERPTDGQNVSCGNSQGAGARLLDNQP